MDRWEVWLKFILPEGRTKLATKPDYAGGEYTLTAHFFEMLEADSFFNQTAS